MFPPLRTLAIAGFLVTALLSATAASAAPHATADRHGDRLFDYQRGPVTVHQISVQDRDGVKVRDITYAGRDGDEVRAYLVEPAGGGRHAAGLYLHWFEPPNPLSSREEFLDEAVGMARQGMVALLPDLTFPWSIDVVGDRRDLDNVVAQTVRLRVGLDLLTSRPNVDRKRVAVVGHDYGGMYGLLLSTIDKKRISAVGRDERRRDVQQLVRPVLPRPGRRRHDRVRGAARPGRPDPVRRRPRRRADPVPVRRARLLRARLDPARAGLAGRRPKDYKLYPDAGHELNEAARTDRTAWLAARLRL